MFNRPYQMSMAWWEGVVEGRQDPLKLGRVQVRVFGLHSDNLQQIPTEDLHWMQVMNPVTSGANSGVGQTNGLMEGTHVIGFFRDGDSSQDGVVMGTINGIPQQPRILNSGFSDQRKDLSPTSVPGKPSKVMYNNSTGVVLSESTRIAYPNKLEEPDLSRLATQENLEKDTTFSSKKESQLTQQSIPVASGGVFSEPFALGHSKYPYNKVTETESGHVIELDDTPRQERVHLYHRTGSFVEMHANGDVVKKSAKSEYNITHADRYSHVEGVDILTVDNGAKILINSENGSTGLELEIGSGGDININVKSGNVNLTVNGDMHQKVSGDYLLEVGGSAKITARRIDLN